VARDFDYSLFEEMEVPKSHATLALADANEVGLAVEAGFTTVKLKAGRDLAKEKKFLTSMVVEYPSLKWRLDFNESLTHEQATDFLLDLDDVIRFAIDFVEDPCPYSDSSWSELKGKTQLKLAVDRDAAPLTAAAQIMVIKPAVDEPFLLGEAAVAQNQRVVMTSYMDHPVGQAFAAWEAARLELQFPGLVGLCGLQTHHLFEADEFTEALGDWSPEFKVTEGTGLGFNDLLDSLPWTKLY
jgi:O-succinylbenzoate synthase